ncbi:hypothetical protein HC026_01180 [Lactobacillus sp. LC28-10]|uniref:Integral membrane protein n=1 Tax=Secundilactobacillus angelensis TaxID=2722706 RepID=A0ABX1KW11_9LACO|nr:hypothetical protein [Secundilactobacillus angelensis]MCH5461279.1 hypothetical protein [Secundilactobacillus angelensis]NLR17525.1 hypothetical protein [Secundilactobacillus angelensis]
MTTILKRIGWPYWVLSIILGAVLPMILSIVPISEMWRSGVIYGLIYSVAAGLIGSFIKRRDDNWWQLFLFPVLFALGIQLSGPEYVIYFALVYLCISYLAYGLSATEGK